MKKYDVIVVGAGTMGMITGYELAKQGKSVMMIDAYDPPHSQGSHFGDTRINRHANGEGIEFVPLALRSQEVWDELQAETNEHVFMKTGVLSFGGPSSKFVEIAIEGAEKYNLESEFFETGSALRERWPDLDFEEEIRGFYEPNAGILFPENILRLYKKKAKEAGAHLIVNTPVTKIDVKEDSVTVYADREEFNADKLVLTAGAYTNKFLKDLDLDIILEPARRTIAWFDSEEELYGSDVFPGFFGETHNGVYYGFPSIHGQGVKIGKYYDGGVSEPEYINREFNGLEHDEVDLRRFLEAHMPKAAGQLNKAAVCIFTNTSDETFVIDKHPKHDHIVIGAGFSGHGFKHAPAVAEMLSQLLLRGETEIDRTAFSIEREALKKRMTDTGPEHF